MGLRDLRLIFKKCCRRGLDLCSEEEEILMWIRNDVDLCLASSLYLSIAFPYLAFFWQRRCSSFVSSLLQVRQDIEIKCCTKLRCYGNIMHERSKHLRLGACRQTRQKRNIACRGERHFICSCSRDWHDRAVLGRLGIEGIADGATGDAKLERRSCCTCVRACLTHQVA
jgi:hypothetical protein